MVIKGKYSREHTWLLNGGVKLRASDAEFLLPEGYRDGVRLDPEKTFVATIASAHMLRFLKPQGPPTTSSTQRLLDSLRLSPAAATCSCSSAAFAACG
jgi:hypothetical protein